MSVFGIEDVDLTLFSLECRVDRGTNNAGGYVPIAASSRGFGTAENYGTDGGLTIHDGNRWFGRYWLR